MSERNPSKQRRAAQNKANRQALAARRARAAEARDAGSGGDEAPKARRSLFGGGPARTATGRPSRSAPARPARPSRAAGPGPGDAPSAPALGPDRPAEPGFRGLMAHLQQVPGGRAVLFSAIFSLVAGGMLLFASVVPQAVMDAPVQVVNRSLQQEPPAARAQRADAAREQRDGEDRETQTVDTAPIIDVFGPIGAVFVAIPLGIAGGAVAAAARPNRRRSFTIAAFALGFYVLFVGSIGIFYFFSMGGLFFAAYQARKADPPVRRPRGRPAEEEDEDLEDEDEDAAN